MTEMHSTEWIARARMRALRLWGTGLPNPGSAVAHLTAMQAQEHQYARWSVAQRTRGVASALAVDTALDDGEILRTHVLRPTWHYVAAVDLRWLIALSGPRVDARNARRYQELDLDARTLARANEVIAEVVASAAYTRRELGVALERHHISVEGQRLAHIVMHAELAAVVCSGPMRGRQHTYAAFDRRVSRDDGPEGDAALAELALRYFSTRGPATLNDFVWWSGLSARDARHGLELASPGLSSRVMNDRAYWFHEASAPRRASRVDLVQCYDEVIISYRESRDVLRTSSASFPVPQQAEGFVHVLLIDGGLLGHWRAVRTGDASRIETRVDQRLDHAQRDALGAAVDRYQQFADESQ